MSARRFLMQPVVPTSVAAVLDREIEHQLSAAPEPGATHARDVFTTTELLALRAEIDRYLRARGLAPEALTGPEHFREAQRLLAEYEAARADVRRKGGWLTGIPHTLTAAQVHAMLAGTAATALSSLRQMATETDRVEWTLACSHVALRPDPAPEGGEPGE